MPRWVAQVSVPALRVAAENAYSGQAFAVGSGADENPSCARLMELGRCQLALLEDLSLPVKDRVHAGQEAATAFGAARMLLTDQGTPPGT
jgi:hypothetical protein